MPLRCLEDLAQRDDLVVQGAARRRLGLRGVLVLPGKRVLVAVNTVFLHQARRDFCEHLVAEEGQEVPLDDDLEAVHPAGAALPLSDYFVFAQELFRRLFELPAVSELAGTVPAAQFQIPVLGKVLRRGQALFLCADAVVPAAQVGRALLVPAVLAFVDVQLSAKEFVVRHCRVFRVVSCKTCVRVKSRVLT